ncbi:hypothetical protein E3E36_08980 [Thermococcus sp. M36]|uniref:hypothetical protein n=1 Tax=Thermococcus sp. M36 TaxID=1638261 RepID=UPI00143AB1C8|nr:hypothetical protein [Thermococcus sp. M36]NJE06272.1 hypothetical protein [Thermococcus sp. M36]
MSKHLKRFFLAYIIVFLPLFFVTESMVWSAVLALLPSWPLLLVWILCDIKHFENYKKFPKEPYIIGDSTEIEYLTPEELEKRLQKGKGNKNHKL